MRYKKLTLKNFKCYKDAEFEFSKITLLTGANSSGKSAIMHALLAPFQSGEFPFNFSPNGKYVNLGDFENIVYRHQKSNKIEIGIEFENNNKSSIICRTSWVDNPPRNLPKLSDLSISDGISNLKISQKANRYQLNYFFDQAKDNGELKKQLELNKTMTTIFGSFIDEKKDEKAANERIANLEKKISLNNKKLDLSLNNLDPYLSEVRGKTSFAFDIFINTLHHQFDSFEENINYISSFRFNPQKLRFEVAKTDLRVGKNGENFEDQIVYWETKKAEKFKDLLGTLKDLKLSHGLKAKRLRGGNYELNFKPYGKSVFSPITDIGFGMSQFLPILVADLQLQKKSTLMVSQPEIHLHPSIQSDFGDFLLKQVRDNNKNYIIETHSEYLINKLRLLVVRGDLKEEDISIYFLQNKGMEVQSHKLKFTKSGKIDNAPKEFFYTYMSDVMGIALNA